MVDETSWNILTRKHLLENLTKFSAALQSLPRITRDFYASLIDRCETKTYHDDLFVSVDKLSRFAQGYDWQGEIRILVEADFVYVVEAEDYPRHGAKVVICFPVLEDDIDEALLDFILKRSISVRKAFVSLDFSDI